MQAAFVNVLGSKATSLEMGATGRGPQKEFFLLAGQAMITQGSGKALNLAGRMNM